MGAINNITQILQDELKFSMTALMQAYKESKDIYQVYWETDLNTTIGSLLLGTSPATSSTRLTKQEYLDGITLISNYIDFITGVAVGTVQRSQFCHNIINGTATPTNINPLVESVGERMKALSEVFVFHFLNFLRLEKIYFDNEIGDLVGVIDAQRIVFGSSMTQTDLAAAITMLSEFRDFMNNSAVATANYQTTLSKWELY